MSLINKINSTGPKTEPWGTPDTTGLDEERTPFTETFCVRLDRNCRTQLKNTNTLLLENTCVTPRFRRTKIFGNNLPFSRNVGGNLNASVIYEMLFIQQKKPKLNTQSDSIKANLFSTNYYPLCSTF